MGYTYEQYLKDLQTQATQSKEAALTAANTLYDQSVKNAEIQRGQAMTAADSALERSKSTYGLTAEYLAQSGLNNSGLSDNMMRDAYAARQSGYNVAGATYADLVDSAERTKADATLDAELKYNQAVADINKLGLEEKNRIDSAFMDIISQITGDTPKDEIDRLIKHYGFSKEQAKEMYTRGGMSLTDDAYYAIVGKTPDSATGGATDGATGGTTDSTTGTDDTTGTIPGGTGDNNTANNVPLVAWERTTNKIKEISDVLPNIGKEGGNSVNEIIDALNAILANGDPAAASALADFYKQEYGVSQGQKTTVGEYLYSIGVLKPDGNGGYTIGDRQRTEVDENGNEILTGGISNISIKKGIKLREGDNFQVTVKNADGSNSTYKVQLGKKSTESAVLNAGANVADEGFFYYNGTLYVKKDGEVWSVEKRDIGRQVSYAEMIGKVTEGLDLSDASFKVTHSNGTSDGDNITFTDSLGNEYKVQIDKKTNNVGAIALSEKYDAQVPFKYGEQVFIKMDDGNVYKIEPRSLGTEKQENMYKNLLDALGRYQSEEQKSDETATKEEHVASSGVKILDVKSESALGNNKNIFVGNEEYSVQTGEEASADVVDAARAAGAKAGDIFSMNGELYKVAETAIGTGYPAVYKLEARKMFKRGDYAELLKALGIGDNE